MAHDHPEPQRQQSGLEMLLAPVMGGAFFLYAMFQARRAPAVKPTPHRVAPEHAEVQLTGWQAKLGHIPVIGAALRVNKRYGELKGNNLAAAGCPNIDTLGPCGGALHSDQEFALISTFAERAKLSFLLLAGLERGVFDVRSLRS